MTTTKNFDAEIRAAHVVAASTVRKHIPWSKAAVSYDLSDILADDPDRALRRFLKLALRLCKARSSGLSLLKRSAAGLEIIRWEAISGVLAAHEGKEVPRDQSPCGACLDIGKTTLLPAKASASAALQAVSPSINEVLIVPLYDDVRRPLGTLWLTRHGSAAHFSSTDARTAEHLGAPLAKAVQLFEKNNEQRKAQALLATRETALRVGACDLADERQRRELAEAVVHNVREALAFKDIAIQDVQHRTKNTLQSAAAMLHLRARASASTEVRVALLESHQRLQLLAKVHELLSGHADDANRVGVSKLLAAVGHALHESLADASSRIILNITAEAIMLPADTAIPLALLANEALTNAYKHAFRDDRSGTITVTLQRASGNTMILQISDNGVGMSPTVAGRKGLGLDLIRAFATQLHGVVATTVPAGGSGTTVTLTLDGIAE
jgi:two-component sensor histidine kinase